MRPEELNLTSMEYLDPEGLPLRVIRRDPEGEFPLHRHDFSELVVICGGVGTHLAYGEQLQLRPGDVFLIGAPGPRHGFCDTDELSLCNILFDRKRLGEALPPQAYPVFAGLGQLELTPSGGIPLHLDKEELERVTDLLRDLEYEQARARDYSAVALVSRFILLIVELARALDRRACTALPDPRRGGEKLSGVLMQLAEHPERDCPLHALARALCVSESTLLRLFRRRTGMSPHEYLMQLRLKKAAALLLGSELAVSEVASECGFSDSNYFCRRFRRYAGMPPSEFRRRKRQ